MGEVVHLLAALATKETYVGKNIEFHNVLNIFGHTDCKKN